MKETKVRRTIHFNDIEKMNRFRMLYGDLFQTLNNSVKWAEKTYCTSSMKGYEYEFIFHMSKENFDMLKRNGIVKKIRQVSYKSINMRDYRKDIWVLC